MSWLKIVVLITATTICAIGSAAATAIALPSILFLSGETVPVKIEGTTAASDKTQLEGESAVIEGEGVELKIELTSTVGPLGAYSGWFKNIKAAGTAKKCETAGDSAGNVLVTGEGHLVFDTLGRTLGQAGVAALVLIPESEVLCEGANFKIRGSKLALGSPVNSEILPSGSFSGSLRCSAQPGRPIDRVYWNEAGGTSVVKLETKPNGGLFEEACENLETNIQLTPSKMVETMT